jgi:hypothetical protein
MGDEFDQERFFTSGRRFQQLNQLSSLFGRQWQGGNAQCSTLGYMVTISF